MFSQVPACEKCGGILKPDVTFFGDNVATAKVDFVYGQVDSCDGLLVAGSSLFVSTTAQHFTHFALHCLKGNHTYKTAQLMLKYRL